MLASDRAKRGQVGESLGLAKKDLVAGTYSPPALFLYATLPYEKLKSRKGEERRVFNKCPPYINASCDLPWNA